MAKSPSSGPAKKAAKKTAKSPVRRKVAAKRPRTKVIIAHPKNLVVDDNDHVAAEAVAQAIAKSETVSRVSGRRSAVDRLDDPAPAAPEVTLVERVSNAIERELSKIEIIIGGGAHVPPLRRTEAESRARVLASLARTLKEVMRLREQEREASGETARAADDDTIPRDLDALRSELARRLEILVGEATRLHPDATD